MKKYGIGQILSTRYGTQLVYVGTSFSNVSTLKFMDTTLGEYYINEEDLYDTNKFYLVESEEAQLVNNTKSIEYFNKHYMKDNT